MEIAAVIFGWCIIGPILYILMCIISRPFEILEERRQKKLSDAAWKDAELNGYDSKKHSMIDPGIWKLHYPEAEIAREVLFCSPYYNCNQVK